MKIHTVHKPCPVPLHWREQRDIDVKRGVLEKIPQMFLIPGVRSL